MKASEIFSIVKNGDKKVRIKLLGDSITHGVGGTGFEQDGVPIVPGWARNPKGYCWAKQFKEYMESHYNCEVVNNACTGTTAQFILEHWGELVDAEDDIILCTIGTNNRHQYFHEGPKPTKEAHMDRLYQAILQLDDRMKATGAAYIFAANIPASAANEQDGEEFWRIFHMEDVNDLYKKAADQRGFALISMYDLFVNYCEENQIFYENLLGDGLHPNDEGYDVMYQLLMEEIGL